MAKKHSPAIKNILLVDDDEDVLASVHRALSDPREGWVCLKARDGGEALTELATKAIDLLITDLRMPGVDGVDLLAIVQRKYRGLPVIVLSGLSDVREASPDSFADLEVLQKPVPTAKLRELVAQVLKRWGQGQTHDISLAAMLRLMRVEGKTCMVQVTDGTHWGEIQLAEGRVVGARLDHEEDSGELLEGEGERAFEEMLSWERTSLDVLPAQWGQTHPIAHDLPTDDDLWSTGELSVEDPAAAVRDPTHHDTVPMDSRVLEMKQQATPDTGALALLVAKRDSGEIIAHLLPPRLEGSLVPELTSASRLLQLLTSLVKQLELDDQLEEIALVTGGLCEVLRPLANSPELFLYGLFERGRFNIAMASLALRSLESGFAGSSKKAGTGTETS